MARVAGPARLGSLSEVPFSQGGLLAACWAGVTDHLVPNLWSFCLDRVMGSDEKNSPISIAGYVTPSDWDRRAVIVTVAVITDGFEKYVVADTAKGEEMLKLIDKSVAVRGTVSEEDLAGNKIISVIDYEVIKNEDLLTGVGPSP